MELRTENWKEFKIGDLFDYQNKTKKKDSFKKQSVYDSTFCIPAISSTVINNSFGYYVKESDHEVINKECISITSNGDAGKVYVQTIPFAIAQDAYVLFLKESLIEINIRKIYLFLAAVIEKKLIQKYSYTNKAVWSKVKNDIIKLPAVYNSDKKDYEPDWSFMEEYISFIEDKYIDKIDEENKEKIALAMEVTGITEEQLDGELVVEEPKRVEEFRVGDLFKFRHGERLTVADREPGNIPFITAGAEKRGIKEHIANHRKLYKNPITIDMFGNTFYHNLKMDGDDNIYFLMGENISENTKLYIATALNKKLSNRYSYSEQFRQKQLNSLIVVLPAIDESTPDFKYMEKAIYIYIKATIKDWKLAGEEKVRMLRKIISV